jgi:hypothetical protein
LSQIGALGALQQIQQQPAPQKPSPSETAGDSVQLSPTALKQLKGGDVDGDGDGH